MSKKRTKKKTPEEIALRIHQEYYVSHPTAASKLRRKPTTSINKTSSAQLSKRLDELEAVFSGVPTVFDLTSNDVLALEMGEPISKLKSRKHQRFVLEDEADEGPPKKIKATIFQMAESSVEADVIPPIYPMVEEDEDGDTADEDMEPPPCQRGSDDDLDDSVHNEERAPGVSIETMKTNLSRTPYLFFLNSLAARDYEAIPAEIASRLRDVPHAIVPHPHPSDVMEVRNTRDLYEKGGIYGQAVESGNIRCPICQFGASYAFEMTSGGHETKRGRNMKGFFHMHLTGRNNVDEAILFDRLATYWNRQFCSVFNGLAKNVAQKKGAPEINSGQVMYHFKECTWPDSFEEDKSRARALRVEEMQLTHSCVYRMSVHHGEVPLDIIGNITVDLKCSDQRMKVMRERSIYEARMKASYTNDLIFTDKNIGEVIARGTRKDLSRAQQDSIKMIENIRKTLS